MISLHITIFVLFQLLQVSADISVSMNPQSKQVPLYKDVFMSCEFRFTAKEGQQSPPLSETGSEIEWLKKLPDSNYFHPLSESKGTGYLPRSVSMRVLSYNEQRQTKTSFLEIVRISESDAGYYKCIISGGKTGGGAETNVAQLQIVPDLSVKPSVVSIEQDRPFRITCNVTTTARRAASAIRGGNRVTWSYAIGQLTDPDDPIIMQRLMEDSTDVASLPNMDFDVSADGSILSVRRARIEHAGYYWCTYEAQSGTFQGRVHERAIVRYGPTYKLNQFNQTNTTRTVKAFVGSTVELYCNIVSLPFAQIEWFKNNKPIIGDTMRHENSLNGRRYYYKLMLDDNKMPTILRMSNLQYQDRDEYVCNVTAFGIRASWSTLLKVKDKYSAFFPLGVIITQMVLIFTLIFGAEKVYSKKGHDHHHHHHHNHQQSRTTSHMHLDGAAGNNGVGAGGGLDVNTGGTIRNRVISSHSPNLSSSGGSRKAATHNRHYKPNYQHSSAINNSNTLPTTLSKHVNNPNLQEFIWERGCNSDHYKQPNPQQHVFPTTTTTTTTSTSDFGGLQQQRPHQRHPPQPFDNPLDSATLIGGYEPFSHHQPSPSSPTPSAPGSARNRAHGYASYLAVP
ncbi:uncharacterized protein LOC142345362 isoform X2 [Convolutriloba macropyga]|uniref:uncharacterized protein LOC142345362 isoform X2 n=1 Tax=Convolutriloba macropyga TaxID=536237 RepID=UPI003F528B6D